MSDLDRARADARRCADATTKATEELDAAKRAEADAVATFDASGADPDLDAASKARLARERAERLHAKRVEEETTAKRALAVLEREALSAQYARERDALSTWGDALAPISARAVEIDRLIDQLVSDAARVVSTSLDARETAESHAHSLGLRGSDLAKPSVGEARLAVRRALLAARSDESREDFSSWLVSAPADWRTSDTAAADLARIEFAARDREALDRAAERQRLAGIEAARFQALSRGEPDRQRVAALEAARLEALNREAGRERFTAPFAPPTPTPPITKENGT